MDSEQFQRIAKALADPRRFEILEHIAKQAEVGCRRLCGCFPVRQATISHHLKELASAGLVESRRDGQFVYYRTRPAVFEATWMSSDGAWRYPKSLRVDVPKARRRPRGGSEASLIRARRCSESAR